MSTAATLSRPTKTAEGGAELSYSQQIEDCYARFVADHERKVAHQIETCYQQILWPDVQADISAYEASMGVITERRPCVVPADELNKLMADEDAKEFANAGVRQAEEHYLRRFFARLQPLRHLGRSEAKLIFRQGGVSGPRLVKLTPLEHHRLMTKWIIPSNIEEKNLTKSEAKQVRAVRREGLKVPHAYVHNLMSGRSRRSRQCAAPRSHNRAIPA